MRRDGPRRRRGGLTVRAAEGPRQPRRSAAFALKAAARRSGRRLYCDDARRDRGYACRAGDRGERQSGASGQGKAASIFPCHAGKLRVKFFPGLPLRRKIASDHRLGHDARQQSKAWQGNGREARKSLGSVVRHYPIIASITIHQLTNTHGHVIWRKNFEVTRGQRCRPRRARLNGHREARSGCRTRRPPWAGDSGGGLCPSTAIDRRHPTQNANAKVLIVARRGIN